MIVASCRRDVISTALSPCANVPPGRRVRWSGSATRFVAAGLRDLVVEQGAVQPVATEHGFGRIAAGRCIDYVLASGHRQLEHAWAARRKPHGRFASDHWPVAARLSLDEPQPTPRRFVDERQPRGAREATLP